jgi:phosphoglycerate dehydrogenase-like enzyme
MSDGRPDVLVLRRGGPGLPAATLHEELSDRLPDRTVTLARTPEEELELARTATVVTGYGMREEVASVAENLALYAHVGIGTDGLPVDVLEENDVAVTNASGLMPQVAEQVVGSLLFFARRFREAVDRQRDHEWRRFQPTSLEGSTVTVVGLGSIGRQTVDRLEGFGVETVGIRHTPSKGGPTDEVLGYDPRDVHGALSRTDYLVLTCPLTETTRGLVDEEALASLPTTAVVVNVARGPVVDTGALTAALRNNSLGGAALDVTDPEPLPADNPLWEFDNVLLTPHTAGNAPEHWSNLADLIARNLDRVDETGSYDELENRVR